MPALLPFEIDVAVESLSCEQIDKGFDRHRAFSGEREVEGVRRCLGGVLDMNELDAVAERGPRFLARLAVAIAVQRIPQDAKLVARAAPIEVENAGRAAERVHVSR